MNMSEKKRRELYKAISEPVFKLRVQIARMGPGDKNLTAIDEKMTKLELEIWRNITNVMKVKR